MSSKIVFILYCILPCAVIGQEVITPNFPMVETVSFGRSYHGENYLNIPGEHFPAIGNIAYSGKEFIPDFIPGFVPVGQAKEVFFDAEDFTRPLSGEETVGQPVYSEPLSLASMIGHGKNKMGASATGGVVYTGTDDVFAYAHYGRTGKLIWRTSPVANNMMATRWSLATLPIFRQSAMPSISSQLR